MNTWDVTVTTDLPMTAVDEELLAALLDNMPSGATAGRSSWADVLAVTATVHGGGAVHAARLGTAFVEHAFYAARGLDLVAVAVEALDEAQTELRATDPEPAELDLVTVEEAAELLQVSPQAVRARAAQGWWGATKVGGTTWVLLGRSVREDAAHKRGQSHPSGTTVADGLDRTGRDPGAAE